MVALPYREWRRAVRRLSLRVVYEAPGEREDCPACGSHDLFDLDVLPLRAGRTGFVCGCDACGLVFSNPLPTADHLAEFYSPTGQWAVSHHNDRQPRATETRVGGTWTRIFDPIRDEVDVTAPRPGASVLDFGCGEGNLLDLFQNCGWQTWGIEPAVDRAFQRHRCLAAIPATPAFDLVLAKLVLEHVANPLQLLRQFAGACRVGGHLLICVPRFDTLKDHRDYRYVLNGRAHITAYTSACLRTLLARTGWEAVGFWPDDIAKRGGGRRTTIRMRALARRVERPLPDAESPGDAARAAVSGYYAHGDSRALMSRLGFLRLAARRASVERRHAKAAKGAGQSTAPGSSA